MRGFWRRGLLVSTAALIILLLIGYWPSSGNGSPSSDETTTTSAPADGESPDIVVMTGGKGCDKTVIARKAMLTQGFAPSEFVVGRSNIDWSSAEANERSATASFSATTPVNARALVSQLSADSDQSKAAVATLMDESDSTRKQLLSGRNWIPVQFRVESLWDGNTAYSGGKAVAAGARKSAAGDVAWLFINPEKCKDSAKVVDIVTAHRAGCGNPQLALPRPTTPSTPTTPTTSPSGEVGKDHRTAPSTIPVVHCPPGQYLDRRTERCVSPPGSTTTTDGSDDHDDDSDDGAVSTTTTPPTTPPVTVPCPGGQPRNSDGDCPSNDTNPTTP